MAEGHRASRRVLDGFLSLEANAEDVLRHRRGFVDARTLTAENRTAVVKGDSEQAVRDTAMTALAMMACENAFAGGWRAPSG